MASNCISQAMSEAENLKLTILSSRDLINDNEARVARQRLQKVYQQLLILDLEQSLNGKVEHDLWSYGFKNYIDLLQKLLKDRKSPKRAEYQGLWNSCLDSASGFYLILLQEICAAFDVNIPLSCRYRSEAIFQINKNQSPIESIIKKPEISSCYYICQYCLIHLGDICRYRLRFKQAASFYRSAILLSPQIGQPYNQLALLEATRNNKLSSVFYYIRSVCCKNPFPGSSTNLDIYLQKCKINQTEVQSKLSSSGFILLFLDVHANLHFEQNIDDCESCIRLLTSSMTTHIATESFIPSQLVQMTVINIYRYNQYKNLEESLNFDKKTVKCLLIELIAGLLNAFLLPVYTYKESDNILQYFALPAIKVTLDWLQLNCEVLTESGFVDNLQIWPGFCRLLNSMQPMLKSFDSEKYSKVALPEEQDLQGFLPLSSIITEYGFLQATLDLDTMNKIRAYKLTQFGVWLANSQQFLIKMSTSEEGTKTFEATLNGMQPSSEFILQLEELTLGKDAAVNSGESGAENSSSLSDSSENTNIVGSTNKDNLENVVKSVTEISPSVVSSSSEMNEKRVGILKPPGYTTKKKGENENTPKRTRENVVQQTILKRNQEQLQQQQEQKQVTFKTPSPCFSAGSGGSQDSLFQTSLPSIIPSNDAAIIKSSLLPEVGKYSIQQSNTQLNNLASTHKTSNTFPTSNYNSSPLNYQMANVNKSYLSKNNNNFPNISDFPNLPFNLNIRTNNNNNNGNSNNNRNNRNNNNNDPSFGGSIHHANVTHKMVNGNGGMLFNVGHLPASHPSQYNNQNIMHMNQGVQNLIPSWHRDQLISQKPWQDDERLKYHSNTAAAATNSTTQPGLDDQNSGLIHRPSSTWQYNHSPPRQASQSQQQIQHDSLSLNGSSSSWPNYKTMQQQNANSRPLFGQQPMHSNPMAGGNHSSEEDQQRNLYLTQPPLPLVPPPPFAFPFSAGNTYSLFNPPTWNHSSLPPEQQSTQQQATPNGNNSMNIMQPPTQQQAVAGDHSSGNSSVNILQQQSLWSGPSPLLRLLEQQKQLRTNQPSYQMGSGS